MGQILEATMGGVLLDHQLGEKGVMGPWAKNWTVKAFMGHSQELRFLS